VDGALKQAMRGGIAGLAVLLLGLVGATPSSALDCVNQSSQTDKVLCSSGELRSFEQTMWNMILPLGDFVDEQELSKMVEDQKQWLNEWARSCEATKSSADIVTCLSANLKPRWDFLQEREMRIAGGRPIYVGGVPLSVTERTNGGCFGDLFLGDTLVAQCADFAVLEPRARYRTAVVDALAFFINYRGNGIYCEPFEFYLVAVRPAQPPEIFKISKDVGSPVNRGTCIDRIARTTNGIEFEIYPKPWADGRIYSWTPQAGLVLSTTPRLAPRVGTKMKDLSADKYASAKLENEQFYRALQAATAAVGIDFAEAAEAFSWSWDEPLEADNFVAMDSCSVPYRGERCNGNFKPKAVYDRLSDKFYFAFPPKGTPLGCLSELPSDTQRAIKYDPPRHKWPEGAFLVLSQAFCNSH
jgi:uncharacterized protein YecT (DUF1311 family)